MRKTIVAIAGAHCQRMGYARNTGSAGWIASTATAEQIVESLGWFYEPAETIVLVEERQNGEGVVETLRTLGYEVQLVERRPHPVDRSDVVAALGSRRKIAEVGLRAFDVGRRWMAGEG